MVTARRVLDAQVHGDLREERAILVGDVEFQAIVAGLQGAIEQVADPPVAIGQGLGHPDRPTVPDIDPVQRHVDTGRVEITSQNHNYIVRADTVPGGADVTHVNLNDGTVEGLRVRGVPAFSVQHHPEAGPGPHDASYLFAEFTELIAGWSY